jgi:hypothetical protein
MATKQDFPWGYVIQSKCGVPYAIDDHLADIERQVDCQREVISRLF